MTRRGTCSVCATEFVHRSEVGPVPARCVPCTADAVIASTHLNNLRIALRDARALISELETKPTVGRHIPGADRQALAAAVIAVSRARGAKDTAAALEHLRDVAHSWALLLGADLPVDHPLLRPDHAARSPLTPR